MFCPRLLPLFLLAGVLQGQKQEQVQGKLEFHEFSTDDSSSIEYISYEGNVSWDSEFHIKFPVTTEQLKTRSLRITR
jgi:hypothetical protein